MERRGRYRESAREERAEGGRRAVAKHKPRPLAGVSGPRLIVVQAEGNTPLLLPECPLFNENSNQSEESDATGRGKGDCKEDDGSKADCEEDDGSEADCEGTSNIDLPPETNEERLARVSSITHDMVDAVS